VTAAKSFAILSLLAIASTLIVGRGNHQWPKSNRADLIEPGTFHGDEITARTGERWMGLYVTKHGAELRYSRIRVS